MRPICRTSTSCTKQCVSYHCHKSKLLLGHLLHNFSFSWYVLSVARDPSKRRVKPTPTVELIPLAMESESEDSDFKIEDDDSASDSSSGSDESDESESEEEESSETEPSVLNGPAVAGISTSSVLILSLIYNNYNVILLGRCSSSFDQQNHVPATMQNNTLSIGA